MPGRCLRVYVLATVSRRRRVVLKGVDGKGWIVGFGQLGDGWVGGCFVHCRMMGRSVSKQKDDNS